MRFGLALLCVGIMSPALAGKMQPHRSAGIRTVQLITSSSGTTEQPASEAGGSRESPAQPLAADFAVHDLSRQWVAFQMAQSLSPEPSAPADMNDQEDPFAHVGVAQPEVAPFGGAQVTQAPVAVPAWMRPAVTAAAGEARFAPGCGSTAYRPAGFLSRDEEVRRQAYFGLMSSIACEYGIPVGLFDAMIIRESRYNPSALSLKSAFGLTQLMPETAAGLGVNRYDLEQNLRGGARYLRQQLDRFGQYHLALAAYNAGPGRVAKGGVPAIPETQAYVGNILENWSRLTGYFRSSAAPSRTPRRASALTRTAIVSSF